MSEIKICLDAGHYGKYNQSPAVKTYYESDMTWKLHLLLKSALEGYGFTVYTTRSQQAVDRGLFDRGYAAKGCDLFLSLHSNAVGSEANETVDYVRVYHLVEDDTTNVDEISKEVANVLAPVIADVMGTTQGWGVTSRKSPYDHNNDGVLNDNYYGVLNGARQADVPGCIVEHSFHTNTKMTNWLLDDDNLQKLADAEAAALAEYFGMEKEAAGDTTEEPEHWYRIRKSWEDKSSQVGAYKSLALAKKNCPDGYSVYDWNGEKVYPEEPLAAQTTEADEQAVWDYLMDKLGNAYGVAGLMGNLYAESALIANNLQNTYNTKLGMTDKAYTDAVDDGTYTAFSSDSAGYGLAQWTYSTRKAELYEYAVAEHASIGNLEMQLAFLCKEMSESFPSVLSALKNANSVKEASDAVLTKYEKPANQSDSVKTKRAGYGQTYYDRYAEVVTSSTEQEATDPAKAFDKSIAGTYKATTGLNVRNGAGTSKSVMVAIPEGTLVKNYGYYTTYNGTKWLYVKFTYDGVTYTGFCSGKYLEKQ